MRRSRYLPLLVLATLASGSAAAQPTQPDTPLDLQALMADMAALPQRHDTFREERQLPQLDQPVVTTGTLTWRRPDYLEKDTTAPAQERVVINGDQVQITSADGQPKHVDLSQSPELRVLVEALRGPLSGDITALRRLFDIRQAGTWSGWVLQLVPRDPAAARFLREIQITGHATQILEIMTVQANGSQDRLTIRPQS
jgi:outer membrane lipoprotein-sorting protein